MKDFWNFNRRISRRLLAWSLFSVVAGFPMWLDTHKPIKATGMQFVVWGLIDGAIAIIGWGSAEKKRQSLPNPNDPAVTEPEARKMRRILLINTGLDVGYIAAGIAMIQKENTKKVAWQGHGWGVLIQGGFLFIFDLIHVLLIPQSQNHDKT